MRTLSCGQWATAPSRAPARSNLGWFGTFGARLALLWLAVALALAPLDRGQAQGFGAPSGLGGFLQGLYPGGQPQHGALIYPQTVNPGSSGNPYAQPAMRLHLPPSPRSLGAGLIIPQSRPAPSAAEGGDEPRRSPRRSASSNAAASLGGGLRTMCVRLCDGYYWPMTFDARRGRVDHDAKVCSASCASEARVFVMPKTGEAKDMVDAQGRPYTKLVNAFKYRKIPAGSCSCRPDPWDDEARARHQNFAETATAVKDAVADQHKSGPALPAAGGDVAAGLPPEPATTKPAMTLADVQVLSLSAGLMEVGTGIPPSARVAEATHPSETSVGPAAELATTAGKSATAPAKDGKPDGHRNKIAVATRPSISRRVPATPSFGAVARPSYPVRYSQQPYVIIPQQLHPYRSY